MSRSKDKNDAKYWGSRPGGDRRGFWLFVVACFLKSFLWLIYQRYWAGMRHVPIKGPVILACNHISQTDPLAVAHFVYNTGRNPSFLAKDGVFNVPVAGKLIHLTGQIPVYRGGADAVKSLQAAVDRVANGGSVIFYPEGTTSKQPEHWPMQGRTGIARLVLETGAPVIPVTVWGPQRLFDPIRRKINLRVRTRAQVVAGPAVDLSQWEGAETNSENLQAITDAIMLRIRDQLAEIRGETPPALYDYKAAKREGS